MLSIHNNLSAGAQNVTGAYVIITVRQEISEALKFHGSPKIAENCNFCGINFCGIDTKFLAQYTVLFILVIHLNVQHDDLAFFLATGCFLLLISPYISHNDSFWLNKLIALCGDQEHQLRAFVGISLQVYFLKYLNKSHS